jgi:hypothetical protein
MRSLVLAALLLFASVPALAGTPAAMDILLTPQKAAQIGLNKPQPAFAVDRRGAAVVAAGDNLFALGAGKPMLAASQAVSDLAFAPDGALLAIGGRRLGYYAAGAFHPLLELPDTGMRLTVAAGRMLVYGGAQPNRDVYLVDPQMGHVKLCSLPDPVSAAAAADKTIFLAAGSDLYRLTSAGSLELVARIPGPPIESLAAVGPSEVFLSAGGELYAWRRGKVVLIAGGLGGRLYRQAGALYVWLPQKGTLLRLSGLEEAKK